MKRELKYNTLSFTVSFLLSIFCYSQSKEILVLDSLVSNKYIEVALQKIQSIDTTGLSASDKAIFYQLYAKNLMYGDEKVDSYSNFIKAKQQFKKLDSLPAIADVNRFIVELLCATDFDELDYKPFFDEYLSYAKSINDNVLLAKAYMQLAACTIEKDALETLRYYKESLRYSEKTVDTLLNAKIHNNIGVLYSENTAHKDSAIYHYNIALKEFKKQGLTDYISYIYNNLARIYSQQEDYDKALEYYLKADSIPVKEYRKRNKQRLYGHISDMYEYTEDYPDALKYLKLHLAYKDSVNFETQNTEILNIQTKYETEKKEKENLKLKQSRFWLMMFLIIALLLIIIFYIAYRNQRNKKKVFAKEKEIQSEKIQKLLKEQELSSLDAMVQGQEKERQRIANDLHDNLGSSLATLKLHFNNLKVKRDRLKEEEEALFAKTDKLIDETYQKVRSMAHAKHAGIKANESLLPAVKNFASKVSLANKLVIEVIDDGMEDVRLDNSLEMTLFRIIQESITNIIKHAQASEANIHLTHHGDSINILVEDNGVGFDTSKIKPKDGMGLNTIQKRVENLNGKAVIESIKDKGTSIIIDIPLEE